VSIKSDEYFIYSFLGRETVPPSSRATRVAYALFWLFRCKRKSVRSEISSWFGFVVLLTKRRFHIRNQRYAKWNILLHLIYQLQNTHFLYCLVGKSWWKHTYNSKQSHSKSLESDYGKILDECSCFWVVYECVLQISTYYLLTNAWWNC
jgi:hypothetical protein